MEDPYCIEKCVQWVQEHNFSKIGLEFTSNPEYAVKISLMLEAQIGFSPVILYDSTRACGNCCVDERTAKPRGIEAVIHFGSTCLTKTNNLPVLYVVMPGFSINLDDVSNLLNSENGPKFNEDLILFYDVLCIHSIDSVFSVLKKIFPNLILSSLIVPTGSELVYKSSNNTVNMCKDGSHESKTSSLVSNSNLCDNQCVVINGRQIVLPPQKLTSDYNFIFVGHDGPTLTSLQMRFADKTFYNIDCDNDLKLNISSFVKVVMSRSKKIEQIKEAKTIGLLFTLVEGYRDILNHLKSVIKRSGKRCYTFYMGKINEAKLGNIVGVDIFVYVGCPESSLFNRIEEPFLYKNIATPWEVEVTLNPSSEWSLHFETDFKELLRIQDSTSEGEKCPQQDQNGGREMCDGNVEKEASSSAVTRNSFERQENSALVERRSGELHTLHKDAAGEALVALSWRGLDPKSESSLPLGTVVEGKKGIASQYEAEAILNKT